MQNFNKLNPDRAKKSLLEGLENRAHIKIKQYKRCRISENTHLNQLIIQKKIEIINLSATNETFVKKSEIESNFFNHTYGQAQIESLVNTMLNKIVI